jgi:hypothetical protein
MDLPSRERWYDYSRARDMMLKATDTAFAPWHLVRSDDKKRARLNVISHFLGLIPYKPTRSSCRRATRSTPTTRPPSKTAAGSRKILEHDLNLELVAARRGSRFRRRPHHNGAASFDIIRPCWFQTKS